MSTSQKHPLFFTGALFNFGAAIVLLLAMGPLAGVMGFEINPTAAIFMQIFTGLVAVFGGVYWMIAIDPVHYRVYIPLGIVLKIWVVAVIYSHWAAGSIPWTFPVLASGDIVYAILFWRYFRRSQ